MFGTNNVTRINCEKFSQIYNEDMNSLGVLKPNIQPHATDFINEMNSLGGNLSE